MFIGRKKELALLKEVAERKIASLVVIKGRRRIGKSRLVEEASKGMRRITLSGIAPAKGVTSSHQKESFARQMALQLNIPEPRSSHWEELFWHLADRTKEGRVLILLDEISWMASESTSHSDPLFLGFLKNAWDIYFKKNDNLTMVLCGSVSSWIEKNILSSTGFVGRITLKMHLKELSLRECSAFWPENMISSFEKFKLLSIMGGIPSYLEKISANWNAEENIRRLCFVQDGILVHEFKQIFTDIFGKRSEIYKKILTVLIDKPNSCLKNIYKALNMNKQGVITEYLEDLEQAGFIKRDYAFNFKTKKISKNSVFRVSDNFIRFYLKYIEPNIALIEQDRFSQSSLSTLKGWEGIAGLQFENLIVNNKALILEQLNINASDVVFDNPYHQIATEKKQGVQIDYLIVDRFNTVWLCEVKFSKNIVGQSLITEIQRKIQCLDIGKSYSIRPVLIHVNGVTDELVGERFFASIIDFGSLLI
ncbi:MAG: AAA family ATPase [Gammaproteobacteria bacterium]|nr:AAA family ATPase [Gammaproteobacteria bacterium]